MWEDRLGELLTFHGRFGHFTVPRDWPENPALARWVTNLRRQVRRGTLVPERVRRLAESGVSWSSAGDRRRRQDREWDRMADKLAMFRKEHGHAEVPSAWPEDPQLGPWVARQRHQCRTGSIREDRRQRLEEAGIEWPQERGRSRTRDDHWDRMGDRLAEFHRRFGHSRIPKNWPEDPQLARWVVRQRHYLRTGALRPDRLARLEELGVAQSELPKKAVVPARPRERAWQSMLDSLNSFLNAHGHCNVPRRWAWNPELGRWVHYQRDLHHRGLLSADRTRRLEALGFLWFVRALPAPARAARRS